MIGGDATDFDAAPQHGPRPLPLFLAMLRSETAASPERRAAALAGLAAYQAASRTAVDQPMPAIHAAGRARLRDYGGSGRAVVFVPSLINPPGILDLGEMSLLRWLSEQGIRPLLVDWGSPTPEERDLDIGGHVERFLVPLLAALDAPPVVVGYCLGGTMAIAAAAIAPVAALATIAAPWHFRGYGDAIAPIRELWAQADAGCNSIGLVPMEVLQAGFWRLDPARTIGKYEAFGRLPPGSAAARGFVRLEDWANAGAPLTYAAGRALFVEFIAADLPGSGRWRVGGRTIDPTALGCPTIEFVSRADRIVPAATAVGFAERRDLAIGHVGMIVGSRAAAELWTPLADWIAGLG